jgi:hypothetical protein
LAKALGESGCFGIVQLKQDAIDGSQLFWFYPELLFINFIFDCLIIPSIGNYLAIKTLTP